MKISQELIEKYHRNECSPEESEAVEIWLYSAESDEVLQLPLNESKATQKADIWKEISAILPPEEQPPVSVRKGFLRNNFWTGAAAASLLIGGLGLTIYQMSGSDERQLVSVNNTSSVNVRHIEDSGYHLSIGTNTSARIDNLTGIADLSGSMLICPKKDITLRFEGSTEAITFKKGQTYIILKSKDGQDKVIVVSEKNLMDLPPVIQKQIINEFNI